VTPLDEDGKYTVVGNLSLLAATREVSFPATVTLSEEGLLVAGKLTIDRTQWGMDGLQDRVNTDVDLALAIGQQTQVPRGGGGQRGGGGGGEGGGRGDPVAEAAEVAVKGESEAAGGHRRTLSNGAYCGRSIQDHDMNFPIEIVTVAIAAPAVMLGFRFLPSNLSTRYSSAVALTAAFIVGYVLLPPWAELIPNRHWHWLPYLAAAAMVLGPLCLAEGVAPIERWLAYAVLSLVSAYLLVPTWSSLEAHRVAYIVALSFYLFLLMVLVQLLTGRVSGKLLVAVLSLV
jgi:hypothetical protein